MKFALLLTLLMAVYLIDSFALDRRHFALSISKGGIQNIVESAVHFLNDDLLVPGFEFPADEYMENFIVEHEEYQDLLGAIDNLMHTNFKSGIPLYIETGEGTIKSRAMTEDVHYKLINKSQGKFNLEVTLKSTNFSLGLPSLYFCGKEGCEKGAYLKFKNAHVKIKKGGPPLIAKAKATISMASNGTRNLRMKITEITSNLGETNGPKIDFTYFKGTSNGKEWPRVSRNQIGPAKFGYSFDSKRLVEEIERNKEVLGSEILGFASFFVSESLVEILNEVFTDFDCDSVPLDINGSQRTTTAKLLDQLQKKKKDENERKNDNSTNNYVVYEDQTIRQDNTSYVTTIYNDDYLYNNLKGNVGYILKDIDYRVSILDAYLRSIGNNSFLDLFFNIGIAFNKKQIDVKAIKGYGSCKNKKHHNCYKHLGQINLSKNQPIGQENVQLVLSESYINSLLKLAQSEGVLNQQLMGALGLGFISLFNSGAQIHLHKGQVYLVAQVKVDLNKIDGYLARMFAKSLQTPRWNTGGLIYFPLEVPITLGTAKKDGKTFLTIDGFSPFSKGLILGNTHGYYSNLSKISVDLQIAIAAILRIKLASFLSKETVNGRRRIERQYIDLSPMLSKMPIEIVPNRVKLNEQTGHLHLFGILNGINFTKLVYPKKDDYVDQWFSK